MIPICYSCHDQMQFQLFGQTEEYWRNQKSQAQEYIDRYVQLGKPVIPCDVCGEKVIYVQGEDGKWTEEEKEDAHDSVNPAE